MKNADKLKPIYDKYKNQTYAQGYGWRSEHKDLTYEVLKLIKVM